MPEPRRLVINTSPLLALIAATGDLTVLKSLYGEVLVPYEVCREIWAGGTSGFGITAFESADWLSKQTAPVSICGDVKVWIEKHRRAAYPEVMAIAGEPVPDNNCKDTLTNPCLVIEVPSKSTMEYDQTDKFKLYRSLESLQEYVLVNQYDIEIQLYTRTNEGFWQYRAYESLADTVHLTSIEVEITVAEIYEGIELEHVA